MRGSPSDCDERISPRRAHCPMVVPDTPASSPTSPARRRPWPRGRDMATSSSSRGLAAAQGVDELEVLLEMARAEEAVLDAQAGVVAAAPRALAVVEQRPDRGREVLEVAWVDEAARLAVGDLVLDAPDARADDRLALPHRLADRQPEPFGEALLHDDVRA